MTGTMGCVGAFSFFPSKNLGCYGDGGMITTNDDEIAAQIKMLRNHGSSQQYHHDVIGYNSRLDELQAVILRIKLKYIDEYNQKRLAVARSVQPALAISRFQTPAIADDRDHVFHQYTVLCDDRDAVREQRCCRGSRLCGLLPYPAASAKGLCRYSTTVELPVTESTASRCLSLPIFPEMTASQIETFARRY